MRFMARNMIFGCVWKRGIVGNMVILIRWGHSQAYARSMLVLESEARHAMTYTGNDDIRSWFPFCRRPLQVMLSRQRFPSSHVVLQSAAFSGYIHHTFNRFQRFLVVLSQQKNHLKGGPMGPHIVTMAAWQATTGDLWSFPLCCEPELNRLHLAHGRSGSADGFERVSCMFVKWKYTWMWVSLYGLCVCKGMCIYCKCMSVNIFVCMGKYVHVYYMFIYK